MFSTMVRHVATKSGDGKGEIMGVHYEAPEIVERVELTGLLSANNLGKSNGEMDGWGDVVWEFPTHSH